MSDEAPVLEPVFTNARQSPKRRCKAQHGRVCHEFASKLAESGLRSKTAFEGEYLVALLAFSVGCDCITVPFGSYFRSFRPRFATMRHRWQSALPSSAAVKSLSFTHTANMLGSVLSTAYQILPPVVGFAGRRSQRGCVGVSPGCPNRQCTVLFGRDSCSTYRDIPRLQRPKGIF